MKKYKTVVRVEDIFHSAANKKTGSREMTWVNTSSLANQFLNDPQLYPLTSMLNRRRRTDGSLVRSGRMHEYCDRALIEVSELQKWVTSRKRSIGSLDGVPQYRVEVDGDGVMERDHNKQPVFDPPLDGLPFIENQRPAMATKSSTTRKPSKTEDLSQVRGELESVKQLLADQAALLSQTLEESRSAKNDLHDDNEPKAPSLLQRIKAVFIGGKR